jgi:hypothetical protein
MFLPAGQFRKRHKPKKIRQPYSTSEVLRARDERPFEPDSD